MYTALYVHVNTYIHITLIKTEIKYVLLLLLSCFKKRINQILSIKLILLRDKIIGYIIVHLLLPLIQQSILFEIPTGKEREKGKR